MSQMQESQLVTLSFLYSLWKVDDSSGLLRQQSLGDVIYPLETAIPFYL